MSEANQKPVAVVVGVGPGLGASLARRFSREYALGIVARRAAYLHTLGEEIRQSGASVAEASADVGDAAQVEAAFKLIREQLGSPDVLLYNVGSSARGTIADITQDQFESAIRANAIGAFLCTKQVAPDMIARGRGVLLYTGATAGVKAGARSVAFGPAKFALRGLAQSLARDLGPRGIHVSWVNIDGAIDIPGRHRPGMAAQDMLRPDAIAETYWHLAHQDRSAWTMELEVRPFKEKF